MVQTVYWVLMILTAISLLIGSIMVNINVHKNNKLLNKKIKEDK